LYEWGPRPVGVGRATSTGGAVQFRLWAKLKAVKVAYCATTIPRNLGTEKSGGRVVL